EMLQLDGIDIVAPHDRVRVLENIDARLEGRERTLSYGFCGVRKDGREIEVEVYGTRAEIDGRTAVIGTLLDVTERKRAQERVLYLAEYDDLTGLPNRQLLSRRLEQRLREAMALQSQGAVLALNIDRLKTVNDSMGRSAGDQIIRDAATRLAQAGLPGDELARIGGDDFVVILPSLERAEDAAHRAERLLQPFGEPFAAAGQERFLTASIGIALFPEDGTHTETLLDAADAALQRVKEQGGNGYRFFTREMTDLIRARIATENGVRKSLQTRGFVLHYQPKIRLSDGCVAGVEALVRWRRPDGRLAPPAEFISVAEDTGLIWQLGEWVLRTACRQSREWADSGLDMPVAVNVSARQFGQEGMLDLITAILKETHLAPGLLEIEITESVIMNNLDKAVATLDGLNALGVRLSIDDFGTGYSSLAYLKRFPIDTLKIDRSFVSDLPGDADDSAIASAVVQMGHSLGVKVVAEGVESKAQLEFLRGQGCDEVQGFLVGMPLPAERVWLSLQSQSHSPYLN
ncbi:MAG TPA: EAL domain-containing protein, partial [Acidiferrobacteraceae bacterium]|nr:EAL domain-containing protein [Acidiferrobacteraceae bacterium]